jgi:AhpD family alkylhydroperoxidase
MCCSTGVCGVDVDQQLVSFAADLDWARQNGAQIERFNLAQQPQAFARNAVVSAFLESTGHEALPLILVDGKFALAGGYPSRAQLGAWAGIASAPSIFTEQVAELVAIGAAIASNCEPCFKYHYDQARKLGVEDADMRRTVDLAQKVKETPHAPCSISRRVTSTRKRRWPPSAWWLRAARKRRAVAVDPARGKRFRLPPNAAERKREAR